MEYSILGGHITVTVLMRYAQMPSAQLDSCCITAGPIEPFLSQCQSSNLGGEHISSLEDRFRGSLAQLRPTTITAASFDSVFEPTFPHTAKAVPSRRTRFRIHLCVSAAWFRIWISSTARRGSHGAHSPSGSVLACSPARTRTARPFALTPLPHGCSAAADSTTTWTKPKEGGSPGRAPVPVKFLSPRQQIMCKPPRGAVVPRGRSTQCAEKASLWP